MPEGRAAGRRHAAGERRDRHRGGGQSGRGGWGLGGALAGWLLAAYGYVEQVDGQVVEQTALALTGIKLLISVFPGVLYISCAFVLIFYNLDETTVAAMKRELEERRAEETPG